MKHRDEAKRIRERYGRRDINSDLELYRRTKYDVLLAIQQRQRVLARFLEQHGFTDPSKVRVLEIGCGSGYNLLELLSLGFRADNIRGLEILKERVIASSYILPAGMVQEGDIMEVDYDQGEFDIVYQSVVFTSLLDQRYQQELAARMWSWVRPGGAVLWYDFVYDNPHNRDVRGIGVRRIRTLFPDASVSYRRVTLAPPIARAVAPSSRFLVELLNTIPWLRTHVMCWISKPH